MTASSPPLIRATTAIAAVAVSLLLAALPVTASSQETAPPAPGIAAGAVLPPPVVDGDPLPGADAPQPSGLETTTPSNDVLGLFPSNPRVTPSPVFNPQREFSPPLTPPPPEDLDTPTVKTPGNPTTRNATATLSKVSPMLLEPLANTAMEQAQSNGETLFTGLGGMPRPLTSPYLYSDTASPAGGFRRGDLSVNTSLSLGFNYYNADGDQRGSSQTQIYATVSPEVDLALGEPATGRVLSLQYFGSLVLGDTDGRQSPYDQTFNLRGVLTFTRLTIGIGLQVSEFSGADRDFGGQAVGRGLISLALTSNYQFSDKTGFESDLTVPLRIFEVGDNSEGVTSTNFVNYNYSPLTTLSFGFAVGALGVEHNHTQVFEQLLTRASYNNGGPLVITGTLGVEFRDTGVKKQINPILGLGATWQVREGTTLALTSERRVFNSAANSGNNFVSSNFAVTATQRFGTRWQATLSAGYENAAYDDTNDRRTIGSNRDDNYVFVQGGIVTKLGKRWSASALATYGNNESNNYGVHFFHTLIQFTFAY